MKGSPRRSSSTGVQISGTSGRQPSPLETKESRNRIYKTIKKSIQKINPDREAKMRKIMASKPRSKNQKRKSSFMAIYVGLLTALGGFLYGYDTGIINGLLETKYVMAHFTRGGKTNFDSAERAIITSILSLGTLFGSLISPIISDTHGRKFCMVVTLIIFNIGTIVQIVHGSYGLILSGRFINGIGVGAISSIIPLYQAEVSPKWIRGVCISFYQLAITIGLLVSSAISQATRNINDERCFRIPIGLQFVWCAFLLGGLLTLPESPRFYVMIGDIDGAIISLSRFRRLTIDDNELIEELIEIKATHDYETSTGSISYLDCFKSSKGRSHQLKRMVTSMALQLFQQASGINFIFYYGVNFFVATGVNESYLMSFITYAVNVVCTIPGILVVDKLGRRKLLMIGALGMTISNFIIAFVGLNSNTVIVNKVMLSFVCTFIAFFAASWGPVVWVVTGELFSLSVRQKAVSLSASMNWIVNFVFAYSTPYLIDQGNHTASIGAKIFFLWGSLNLAGFLFTFLFVYETEGLMLEEVDELYHRCSYAFQSHKYNKEIQNGSEQRTGEEETQHDEKSKTNHESVMTSVNTSGSGDCEESESIYSPMDYLNRWAEKRQRNSILNENILTRPTNELPQSLELTLSDENSGSSGAGSQEIPLDFNFSHGLYGETVEHSPQPNLDDNEPHEDEEEYHAQLDDVINYISEQSGFDLHPPGVD